MPLTFKNYLTKNKKNMKNMKKGSLNNMNPWKWGGFNYSNDSESEGHEGASVGGEDEEVSSTEHPEDELRSKSKESVNTNPGEEQNTSEQDTKEQDPDKQGLIRAVKGAKLVYKRETNEGTFEELWIYQIDVQQNNENDIRKEILSGTDIPVDGVSSEDGEQTYSVWTVGNAQLVKIEGLPN